MNISLVFHSLVDKHLYQLVVGCFLFSALGACGGGSSTAPKTSTLSFSGTVANGAPISNTEIQIKCLGENNTITLGKATTDINGQYTANMGSSILPCMFKVKNTDATEYLHSFASAQGNVNITPLTNALFGAAISKSDVTTYFNKLEETGVKEVQDAIAANASLAKWSILSSKLQKDYDIDVNVISSDPISHVFSASPSNRGIGHDKVLDDLKVKELDTEKLFLLAMNKQLPPNYATDQLNDTGVDFCGEDFELSPPNIMYKKECEKLIWNDESWGKQQDAYFGNDNLARNNKLIKIGSGKASFDFTKIGKNGKAINVQNKNWTAYGEEIDGTYWECVRDNNTGLFWETKHSLQEHLQFWNQTYSWKLGDQGSENPFIEDRESNNNEKKCNLDKCNIQEYINIVNDKKPCGKDNWRLPTVDELITIVNYGNTYPGIDQEYFPNHSGTDFKNWTNEKASDEGENEHAWYINFGNLEINYEKMDSANYIRLVSSKSK